MSSPPDEVAPTLLAAVAARLRAADVFDSVEVAQGRLLCRPRGVEAEAQYRLESVDGRLAVSLVTPDRWLSESIEADLLHAGDSLEELVDEELVEQGFAGGPLPVEHYRSDDLLFTFRSRLPAAADESEAAARAAACLLAYAAALGELGDMSPGEGL